MIGANTVCDVYRASETVNDYGEPVLTWALLVSSVPCRFVVGDYARRVELQAVAGAQVAVATHMVLLPADTDVVAGDRLERELKQYEVLSADDIDNVGHHIQAHVVRLEGVT